MESSYLMSALAFLIFALGLVFGILPWAGNAAATNDAASIELRQTAGNDPTECATTQHLVVLHGTSVIYSYKVLTQALMYSS